MNLKESNQLIIIDLLSYNNPITLKRFNKHPNTIITLIINHQLSVNVAKSLILLKVYICKEVNERKL